MTELHARRFAGLLALCALVVPVAGILQFSGTNWVGVGAPRRLSLGVATLGSEVVPALLLALLITLVVTGARPQGNGATAARVAVLVAGGVTVLSTAWLLSDLVLERGFFDGDYMGSSRVMLAVRGANAVMLLATIVLTAAGAAGSASLLRRETPDGGSDA